MFPFTPTLLGCAALVFCALTPLRAHAQQDPIMGPRPNLSFGNITVLMGRGTSDQRGEHPQHTTLGVALGVDFFHRRVLGNGQLRGKFLTQEDVRDPDFVCAQRDCGPAHRLGLQADAYVDLTTIGRVGLGVGAGVLVFRGTVSTMVVNHPSFEKGVTSASIGPSITLRGQESYFAVAPVVNFKHEQTLANETLTGMGGGITAALGWIRGPIGFYADGRYFSHPESSDAAGRSGDSYVEEGNPTSAIRADGGVMADGKVRMRIQVGAASYINVGGYVELSRSDLRFLGDGRTLPREFRDSGISLSFEFLQY